MACTIRVISRRAGDLGGQVGMLGRIDLATGRPPAPQGAPFRLRPRDGAAVDAAGQAADNGPAGAGQVAGDASATLRP